MHLCMIPVSMIPVSRLEMIDVVILKFTPIDDIEIYTNLIKLFHFEMYIILFLYKSSI